MAGGGRSGEEEEGVEGGEIKGTGLGQDGVEKGRWVSGQDGVACVEDGVAIGRLVSVLEGGV